MDWFDKAKQWVLNAVQAVRNFDFTTAWAKFQAIEWTALFHKTRDWVRTNRNNILIGAGIFVAAVVFLGWFLKDRAAKEDDARQYFSQALNSYNRGTQARDLSPEERRNELGRALQIIQEMQRRFPSASLSSDAVFYMGNILFESGDYAQAIGQFELYIQKYPNRYLAPYAAENIGYCHEQANDLPRAIAAFEQVRQRWPKSPVAGRTGLNVGRCREAQGDFKSAFESYQSVQADAPNSAWARQAYLRLTYLEARFQHGSSAR